MMTSVPLKKSPTGIEGFDEITGGGLPRNRATLVLGGAGAGKTLFALQTLVNGARQNAEPGILVTFEESSEQILTNAAALGWDIPSLEKDKLFFLDTRLSRDQVKGGQFDLMGILASIHAKADEMKAARIVLDGVDVLLRFLDSPELERSEFYRLHNWLEGKNFSCIITGKAGVHGDYGGRYDFMQFMVDCVVLLLHRIHDRVSFREVRIAKYRGSSFAENEFPMTIGPTGIEVAGAGSTELRYPVSTERVSTGLESLDQMMGGGYFRGTGVMISGSPGTAKSTLAGLFTLASCLRGERVLYISLEEAGNEIVRNLSSVNISLGPHIDSGVLKIHSIQVESKNADSHLMKIMGLVRELKPRNLVIDPISEIPQAGGVDKSFDIAQRLLRLTKKEGITTVFTCLLESSSNQHGNAFIPSSAIGDTWIHLSYITHGGERNRALNIFKARGTRHSNQIRELTLTDTGIILSDVYRANGQIFTGTARKEKETAEKMAESLALTESECKRREFALAEADINARMGVLKLELEIRRTELNKFEESLKNIDLKKTGDPLSLSNPTANEFGKTEVLK